MAKKHNNHHHKNKKKNKSNQQAENTDNKNQKNANSSGNETSDESEPILTTPKIEEPTERKSKSRCSCFLVFFLLISIAAAGFVGYLAYENKLDKLNDIVSESVEFLSNTKDQIYFKILDQYNAYFPNNENTKVVNNDYCFGEDCHTSDDTQVDETDIEIQREDSIINKPTNTLEGGNIVKKQNFNNQEINHFEDEIVNEISKEKESYTEV